MFFKIYVIVNSNDIYCLILYDKSNNKKKKEYIFPFNTL